jgi:glycosyltransferase involved in cell wall biosynthesis
MSRMRVVHIIKATRVAGAENHLLALLAGLRARRYDARLIVLVEPDKPMDSYAAQLQARQIPVERLPVRGDFDAGLLLRLRAVLRALQPDIVHTHLIHADLFGGLAARLAGIRLVISSRHNDDAFRRRLPVKLLNRVLWRMTDAGIPISDSIARFSIEVEGAPPGKLRRIHYGLEAGPPLDRAAARRDILGERGLPPESLLVGIVCRLVEQKGVRYGIEAFLQIAADFPQVHLLIAGQGPLETELRALAAPLEERVHFLGWRDDTPRLMAALDALLVPSLWEGFGLVILEAMAQQTPVIGSAVSAIPEIITDGETGLLAPPRSADKLADALRTLLADAPLRHHLGLLARDRLESFFDAARMAAETAALYEELYARSR